MLIIGGSGSEFVQIKLPSYLQRKWQDKDGHDRYSTEVVLQGFNSQLIMLDTRGRGGAADTPDSDFGDRGANAAPGKSAIWTTRFRSEGWRPQSIQTGRQLG